jgi:hypothetical protein
MYEANVGVLSGIQLDTMGLCLVAIPELRLDVPIDSPQDAAMIFRDDQLLQESFI